MESWNLRIILVNLSKVSRTTGPVWGLVNSSLGVHLGP